MIPFLFNKNRFSFFFFFFFCWPSTSWPVMYKSQERYEPCIMSESDTIFNERDRRCAAVKHMLSTDPSYDNRTIASTLKMQIWIATTNRDVPWVMKTKFPATVMVFGVVSSEGRIMPPHIFEVGLKVNTKVYLDMLKNVVIPWCNQVTGGRPWMCQQDSAPAYKFKETQAWLQKVCNDFVPFSHWPPLFPRPEPAGLLSLVIRREHHQHNLPQHQSRPDRRHLPSCRRRLRKRHAPSSGSVSRWWLRLKAAILNRCQLYYIIKLPELIFSIKVL